MTDGLDLGTFSIQQCSPQSVSQVSTGYVRGALGIPGSRLLLTDDKEMHGSPYVAIWKLVKDKSWGRKDVQSLPGFSLCLRKDPCHLCGEPLPDKLLSVLSSGKIP